MRSFFDVSEELRKEVPGVSFYCDAKDGQAPSYGAAISYRPDQYENSAIAVYPYGGIYDAGALAKRINHIGAHKAWSENVLFLPVPYFDAIKANHFQGYNFSNVSPAEKYDMIYEKTKLFAYSFVKENSKVKSFAIMLAIAGLGIRYDKQTGTADDEAGVPVDPGTLLDHYMWDAMLIQLYHDLEKDYPKVPFANIVRQYDYMEGKHRGKWAPVDGRPAPWGKSAEYNKALATFPRCLGLQFDLWIVDEFLQCVEKQAWLDAGEPCKPTHNFPASNLIVEKIK